MRDTEHEEFLAGEEEMLKATGALDQAIHVLDLATKEAAQGVFLEQRAGQREGQSYAAIMKQSIDLERATELGNRVLSKADAFFLRRILGGDVPKPDWKKLNRKATFKMSYKARSFKIQELLAGLNKTITNNLVDARSKEAEALALFEKLMESKGAEKTDTEEALLNMESETGARGLNKEEAQAEVDALKTQVENDKKFIDQTETSLAEKKEEWKDRIALRAGEIAALSKAVEILSSDDARDTFKKSLDSQGYFFLQESQQRTRARTALASLDAAAELRRTVAAAGGAAGSARLSALAKMLTAGGGSHFTEVLGSIDKMIAGLSAEEESDLARKEQCETDRMERTRDASVKSRDIDDLTDTMTRLTSEIAEIDAEIKEKQEAIKDTQGQLEAATKQRADENAEWKVSDADDTAAAEFVERAKQVLESFYADNNLMLLQQPKAGQAPPPPPSTWDAPYGGKTGESTGIIGMLDTIKADMDKDRNAAKIAETKAQTEFDAFEQESNDQIDALNADITTLEGVKGDKEESITQHTTDRRILNDGLQDVMETIKSAQPGCDYIMVNYKMRVENRHTELDGLTKAKAILKGGKFNSGPDPNREIKPGDAFLQRAQRHAQ